MTNRISLSESHPHIAKEAHGWDPNQTNIGSKQKLEWRCAKGHIYEMQVGLRTQRGYGCPYCSNRRVWVGFNDLGTTFPEIAAEAYGWDPKSITAGNDKNREWICPKSHIYIAKSMARTGRNRTGCPYCAHQKILVGFNDLATTHPDTAKDADGWDPKEFISGSKIMKDWICSEGHKTKSTIFNRARAKIGCGICNNSIILSGFNDLATKFPEIAKEAHDWDPSKVSAYSNKKARWKCQNKHIYSSYIYSRTYGGNNCPICVNQSLLVGFNDLETTHPELSKEAHGWDPKSVTYGSEVKQEWKCKLGHIFKASPNSRTSEDKQSGCPYCSSKSLLVGFNDLKTKFPEIAREADGWDPTTLISGSRKQMNWKCQYGHKFKASLDNRTRGGTSCPSCTQFGFDPNKDAYLYFLSHESWGMFQIGITNVPEVRLASHMRLGWEVLELRGPMEGFLTQNWETDILKMLKHFGADLSNEKVAGRFDGYTEAWSKSTFFASSITELMRKTEEFENE